MTTTEPSQITAVPPPTTTKAQVKPKAAPDTKAALGNEKPDVVTLDALARDLKVSPRDARMLLRLAAKQKAKFPNLGKDHVARQPWQWAPGSKALDEARRALTTSAEA